MEDKDINKTNETTGKTRSSESELNSLVMPEAVTLSDSGSVLTGQHDGFDYTGELTFDCVNNFVHDAGRHFEELQWLALGMIGQLEEERMKNKKLIDELMNTSAEAYQVVGVLSDCAQLYGHSSIENALDYFGDIANGEKGKRFKGEILPFSL